MNDAVVLEMKNITKRFPGVLALDKVQLTLHRGEVHVLLGENGAGKSTLMNILTDIYKADSGDILLNGKKVVFKNSLDAARHGIGMIYQEFMLYPELSVYDNLILGFEEKKLGVFIDKKACKKKIGQICRDYSFDLPMKALVKDLPVAVLQQVEIVKALYRSADIIIMDEPTSVLTPQGIQDLFRAMRNLVAAGKTIIFISHKLKEVFEIADRITVMKDGRISGEVLPSEVTENQLASMMVGRDVILQANKLDVAFGEPVLSVKNLKVKDKDGVLRVKGVDLTCGAGRSWALPAWRARASSSWWRRFSACAPLRRAAQSILRARTSPAPPPGSTAAWGSAMSPRTASGRERTGSPASGRPPSWAITWPMASRAVFC